MGVKGLYQEIEASGFDLTLAKVCSQYLKDWNRAPVLGIDMSILLRKVEGVGNRRAKHSHFGANPELKTLCFQLFVLASFPVDVTFVFDGLDRPEIKRGARVSSIPHWLTEQANELAVAFGFATKTAPGEAEAELAALNMRGQIDVVVTNDIDCFLFGALNGMLVPSFSRSKPVEARAFTSKGIERAGLTRATLILVAVMAGGDYNPGLRGCGVKLAIRLSQYGLDESLYSAAKRFGEDAAGFGEFLATWRKELKQMLRYDPQGFLKKAHPTLADSVTQNFPDPSIILAYTNPIVSQPAASLNFTRKAMDLCRIGRICRYSFSFGDWASTLAKLEESIFTAVGTEALQQLSRNKEFPRYLTGYWDVIKTRTRIRTVQFCLRMNCRLMVDTFHSGFDNSFIINHNDEETEIEGDVWVHGFLLAHSHPRLVAEHYISKKKVNPFENDEVEDLDDADDAADAVSVISISSTETEVVIDLSED